MKAFISAIALASATGAMKRPAVACAAASGQVVAETEAALRASSATVAEVGQVVEVCSTRNMYVATARLPARNASKDYGPRVLLLRRDAAGMHVVAESHGEMDSDLPRLKVYAADGHVLVLAALGDEGGSWGFDTYEASGTQLRTLGILDIGSPGHDDTGNDQALGIVANVERVSGTWQATFNRSIVLRPNQAGRRTIHASVHQPVHFRPHGTSWVRVP
jgi:hypothetical protein